MQGVVSRPRVAFRSPTVVPIVTATSPVSGASADGGSTSFAALPAAG